MRLNRYYYFVEGKCEEKLLETLKEQRNMLLPGRIHCFNMVQERISEAMIRAIPPDTTVILVFDTDTDTSDILRENIRFLKSHYHIKAVWCVMQIENLEDELVRSTDVSKITELTDSKSEKDFKRDFIHERNLFDKLERHAFDYDIIWSQIPSGSFSDLVNDGARVKIKRNNHHGRS